MVCEGLSRCIARAGAGVGAARAKVTRVAVAPAPIGAMRTRDQGTT